SDGTFNKNKRKLYIHGNFHYTTENDTPLIKEEIWAYIKDLDLL
ncbi:unnamed protein product, partial [marine sediment metagenome]